VRPRQIRSVLYEPELLDYVARSAGDAEIIRIEGLEAESAIGLAGLHRLLLSSERARRSPARSASRPRRQLRDKFN
jgi:hypothetical protein